MAELNRDRRNSRCDMSFSQEASKNGFLTA